MPKQKTPQKTTKQAEKKKQFTFKLPENLYMDFKIQTEKQGKNMDAVIERLIYSYILEALEPEDGCFCCPKEFADKHNLK